VKFFLLFLVFLITLGCSRDHKPKELGHIEWRTDYQNALKEAQKEGRPIFVYFSAVWCSWCREYEKELSKIAPNISRNLVPLLLDSDRDRNLFLNFGGRGTPFTVILSPMGRVLVRFHGSVRSEDLKDIIFLALEGEAQPTDKEEKFTLRDVSADTYSFLRKHYIRDLESRYDPTFGGFSSPSEAGSVFKWSTPLTYMYLLESELMEKEVLFSLRKDIEFLYDPVDGGFFNFYDRTRAYSFYFETSKSLRVNALMITALLKAYEKTGKQEFLRVAFGTYRYMISFLYHRDSGCFLNAQMSDPDYYNLKPEERRRREPPPADTAIIVEDNAKVILALLELYRISKDESFRKTALDCARYIEENLLGEEGLYRYVDVKNGKRGVLNMGRDMGWLALAFLRLSEEEVYHRKTLLRILSLKPSHEDWVSRSMIAYTLSFMEKDKARQLLEGMEIDLSYQNPDDIVFLLRSLENLIERDEI